LHLAAKERQLKHPLDLTEVYACVGDVWVDISIMILCAALDKWIVSAREQPMSMSASQEVNSQVNYLCMFSSIKRNSLSLIEQAKEKCSG
jgi:hypothetical protein